MRSIPVTRSTRNPGTEAEAKVDAEAEAEARLDAEAEAEARLQPEAEGEL
jgi:hypothetical protein